MTIISNSFVETKTTPKMYFRVTSVMNGQADLTDTTGNRHLMSLSDIKLVTDPLKLQELGMIFNPQP